MTPHRLDRDLDAVDGADVDCQHCGGHVTQEFARVFGDDRGSVHRCLSCDSKHRIHRGSAAGATVDHPDPQRDGNENRLRGFRVRGDGGGV